MELNERKNLLDLCYGSNRVLKEHGYYCNADVEAGRRPEDLDDINIKDVQEITGFLNTHPVYPNKKSTRRKRIKISDSDGFCYYVDVYLLGYSYGLKHVIERFLPSQ